MRITGLKIGMGISASADEIRDAEEYGKSINICANANVEIGEIEVAPTETKELFNCINELIHSELTKEVEVRKDKDIKFLEKELDKKNKELEKFRNE